VLTRLQPSIRKADQERIGCNDARFESVFANARCHHASPADYETGTIGYQVREVSHRCDVDPGGAVDLKPADYLSFRDYGRPTRNVRGRWPQAFPVAHREAGPPNHPIVVSCFGPSRPLEKIMPAPGNLSTMNPNPRVLDPGGVLHLGWLPRKAASSSTASRPVATTGGTPSHYVIVQNRPWVGSATAVAALGPDAGRNHLHRGALS
jgi:hypothetical protein